MTLIPGAPPQRNVVFLDFHSVSPQKNVLLSTHKKHEKTRHVEFTNPMYVCYVCYVCMVWYVQFSQGRGFSLRFLMVFQILLDFNRFLRAPVFIKKIIAKYKKPKKTRTFLYFFNHFGVKIHFRLGF